MATRLFARSPRYVQVSGSANDEITCEIYIWNNPDSAPLTPTYTLSKPIPSSVVTDVYFNISPYVREYIEHVSFTAVTSQTAMANGEYCYCNVTTKINGGSAVNYNFICFNGYGEFEDGANPQFNKPLLDDGTYYVKENSNGGGFYIHNDSAVNLQVKYSDLNGGGTQTINVTGEVKYFPYVHNNFLTTGNILQVYNTSTASVTNTYIFEAQCEPKYTPVECDFVNKYGVWQRLIFFKAKRENVEVSNTEYKMLPSSPSFNTSVGYKKPFNINGVESLTLNTGFVPEDYAEVIQQLMLSEVIKLDGKPAKMRTKATEKFSHLNSKLINYQLEFEYANDIINNIM